MFTYITTCISGTIEIVKELLEKNLENVQFVLELDGLLVYKSSSQPEMVKQLRGVNNSFLVIKTYQNLKSDGVEVMIKDSLKSPDFVKKLHSILNKRGLTIRVMAANENQTVALDRRLLSELEGRITQKNILAIHRNRCDYEIWFMSRSEGFGFSGVRLTMNKMGEKDLRPGQLRPELAHLLCLLSQPDSQDVFLDPFAGYGGIVFERTNFKSKEIIAVEKDPSLVEELKLKVKTQNKKISVTEGDAAKLSDIGDGTISKIVTDPPWGFYDGSVVDLVSFYNASLTEMKRVLKENGLVVVICGRKEDFEKAIKLSSFVIKKKYDILVSGKKAGVFVLN